MKKILAVSGGIDSVVMLHLLKDEQPIVAHFDHGIRSNSHEDAAFVERLANEYGLQFEMRRAELGANCSEASARVARYAFLRQLVDPIFRMSTNNMSEEEIKSITLALAHVSYQAHREGADILDFLKSTILPLEATKPYDTIAGMKGHLVDKEANKAAIVEFLYSED